MKSLYIKVREKIPSINFNPEAGRLELTGRSLLENAQHFYDPIIQWVKECTLHPLPQTELEIKLDYFNSSSSKSIFKRIKLLR